MKNIFGYNIVKFLFLILLNKILKSNFNNLTNFIFKFFINKNIFNNINIY